jgi:hypothetical protein
MLVVRIKKNLLKDRMISFPSFFLSKIPIKFKGQSYKLSKMESKIKQLDEENSVQLDYNEINTENNQLGKVKKLREINDLKFPTFDNFFLEEQLKVPVTIDALLTDLKSCLETFEFYESQYDEFFRTSQNGETVKEIMKEHNLNCFAYKIFSIFIKRHVTLFYYLLIEIFKCENKPYNYIGDTYLNQNFIDINYQDLTDNLLSQNKFFVSKNIEEEKIQIIKLLENLIKNEKEFVNFIQEKKDYIPSICSLDLSLKILKNVLDQIIEDIRILSSPFYSNESKSVKEEMIIKFFQNLNKLEILATYFLLCYKIPHDDIFNLPEDSETWCKIKEHMERKVIYSRHVLKKKLQNVYDMVILGNASMSKGHNEFSGKFSKILGTGWYFAYFFFNKKQANIQSIKFAINPDYEVAQKIWNMLDTKGIKSLLKITLPGVKYSKKWYLRRTEQPITLERITKLIEKANSISSGQMRKEKRPDEVLFENYYDLELNDDDQRSFHLQSQKNLIEKEVKEKDINEFVKVRIINHVEFFVPTPQSFWKFMSCCRVERNYGVNSLIVHIHGGGFIAMSASSHENYTRKWTNKLGVPVFSIDYRLAPENPYPKALDDVYQAYMWIIKYAEDVFKMEIKKIILVGDSAGGNLVVSLTYLLILLNKKLPTALCLAYPGTKK